MPMTDPQLLYERLARNSWGLLGQQGYVMGIDLGGYGLRVLLVNLQTHALASTYADRQSNEDNDPQTMLQEATTLARTLLTENRVPANHLVRIGVGFGAPIDSSRGVVLASPRQPQWEQVPIKQHFEEAFDTTTLVDNDANLIALSEATFGIGNGCQHLFYLHLSSGVGGGMVLEGRLYHGATAMAGEVGHARGDALSDQPHATLEDRVSIGGLLRRAGELGLSTTNLNDIFGPHPTGQQVVDETVTLLGLRLAHIVALLDPQMIVLGGIVVRIGGDAFVQAIANRMKQGIAPALVRPVQVVPAMLSTDSIAIGAMALALESLSD